MMIDFIAAFEEGIHSAEISETNKREISEVFDELNKQLANISGNKIKIGLKPKPKPQDFLGLGGMMAPHRTADTDAKLPTDKLTVDQIIYAFNPLSELTSSEELAYWTEDNRNGYPCKIQYGGKSHYCEDKVAIEDALANLLKEPLVGKSFRKLSKLA